MNPPTVQIGILSSTLPGALHLDAQIKKVPITTGNWKDLILKKDLDGVLMPLWQLPLEIDESLVIGALTKRLPSEICLVKVNSQNPYSKLRALPSGFKVYSDCPIYLEQLSSIRKDVAFTTADSADYWLLPKYELGHLNDFSNEHIVFEFKAQEIAPLPGAGVWAFLTSLDDLPIRKFLASIHDNASSRITNIERGVAKELGTESIAVYGQSDNNGYLHFAGYYSSRHKSVSYSSATTLGLVQEMVRLFNQ